MMMLVYVYMYTRRYKTVSQKWTSQWMGPTEPTCACRSSYCIYVWLYNIIKYDIIWFNIIQYNKLRWYPHQPQRRNVLFLQIFLKRGNTSAGFPWVKWPQILLNLTWLCTKASQTFSGTFCGTFSGTLLNLTWLWTKASRNLLWNLLQNVTWLCTKASWNIVRNLLRNPVEPDLALHQSLQDLLRNLLRNPVERDLALHQSLPDLLRNLRNLLRNLVEPDPAPAPVHTRAILGWRPISLRCWGI